MIHSPRLAIDAMGGDVGPACTVPATIDMLSRCPELRVELYGDHASISEWLTRRERDIPTLADRVEIVHCSQVVGMAEKPSSAVRSKHESSMWRALQSVAEGRAHACVSAGNTGTLMAMGMAILGTLPGVDRPAVCTAVPTRAGHSYLLDLGANVDCTASQLHRFAVMASLMVAAVDNRVAPSVALLNLAEEGAKGNREVRAAAALLAADATLNYLGFVEGDGIFAGEFDIIVCDGFAGNVALKASEGVAGMVLAAITQMFDSGPRARLAYLLLRPRLRELRQQIDPAAHNGASLLGLRGVVVKSHGRASREGFGNGLAVAMREAERNVPAMIGQRLAAATGRVDAPPPGS